MVGDREHTSPTWDSAGGGGQQGHPCAPLLVSQIVLVSRGGQWQHTVQVFTASCWRSSQTMLTFLLLWLSH